MTPLPPWRAVGRDMPGLEAESPWPDAVRVAWETHVRDAHRRLLRPPMGGKTNLPADVPPDVAQATWEQGYRREIALRRAVTTALIVRAITGFPSRAAEVASVCQHLRRMEAASDIAPNAEARLYRALTLVADRQGWGYQR